MLPSGDASAPAGGVVVAQQRIGAGEEVAAEDGSTATAVKPYSNPWKTEATRDFEAINAMRVALDEKSASLVQAAVASRDTRDKVNQEKRMLYDDDAAVIQGAMRGK